MDEEEDERIPVGRVYAVSTRHRDRDDFPDGEAQEIDQFPPHVPGTVHQLMGEPDQPSSHTVQQLAERDAIVGQLQAQMSEMTRAMAAMAAQLAVLGVPAQAAGTAVQTVHRGEPSEPRVSAIEQTTRERVSPTIPRAVTPLSCSTPSEVQPLGL
ncbi:hypothetical protein EE085_29355, partial [Klebsiella pneumoniae]|nr:hypothetical protein [Klebsiella pneumoniae]